MLLSVQKPGKDVQSIIEDITSQRERDEMQELERYQKPFHFVLNVLLLLKTTNINTSDHYLSCISVQTFSHVIYYTSVCSYIPERARSRSPLSRSLSPHSHSPSFTSCSSTHSPQGAPCRGQERGTNGLAPSRGSWDWSPHIRRSEDERERDDPWRNGGGVDDDRPNGRGNDRRKSYQKPLDHTSSRSGDERGGGEGMRGNRDWHVRSSPQGASFNSYRSMDEDFYMKEQTYKSDKLPRTSYQRHDAKPKRRDCGDYHSRPRHYEFEVTEEPLWRAPEEKRQTSPGRGRSEKTSKRHTTAEKNERDKAAENTVSSSSNWTSLFYDTHELCDTFFWRVFQGRHSKDKSPQRSNKTKEAPECNKDRDAVSNMTRLTTSTRPFNAGVCRLFKNLSTVHSLRRKCVKVEMTPMKSVGILRTWRNWSR